MTTKQISNTSRQKPIRQTLRNNLTTPEQKRWARIRNKQLGVRFRRQYGIGRYVVDFYCPELVLVIELDGNSHYIQKALRSTTTCGMRIWNPSACECCGLRMWM